MKKFLLASVAILFFSANVYAEDTKIGILLGFTGPIESLTPDMAAGAEAAIAEVNAGGGLLGGPFVGQTSTVTQCPLDPHAPTLSPQL